MNHTKIYFVCPKSTKPSGGIKQIYRQVDILNKNGFNAVILHKKAKYRSTWFKNNTPVESNFSIFYKIDFYLEEKKRSKFKTSFKRLMMKFHSIRSKKLEPGSVIVFPEVLIPAMDFIEPDSKKIIFNQNCYLTFQNLPFNKKTSQSPYTNSNTLASIVVSQDSKEYLEFAFPNINLHRLRLGINHELFFYKPNKKKQIAFMPRKTKDDVNQVINILKQRNSLKNWNFVEIDNKSESEVAQIMQESYLYLSFSHREGFGLPPAEAMVCGAIVIGYTGRAGKEFFKEDLTYQIEEGDIINFTTKIEEIVQLIDQNENLFIEKGKKASEYILREYNLKNEEEDIVSIYNTILNKKLN